MKAKKKGQEPKHLPPRPQRGGTPSHIRTKEKRNSSPYNGNKYSRTSMSRPTEDPKIHARTFRTNSTASEETSVEGIVFFEDSSSSSNNQSIQPKKIVEKVAIETATNTPLGQSQGAAQDSVSLDNNNLVKPSNMQDEDFLAFEDDDLNEFEEVDNSQHEPSTQYSQKQAVLDSFKSFEKQIEDQQKEVYGSNPHKRRRSSVSSISSADNSELDGPIPRKRQDQSSQFPWITKKRDHSGEKEIARWLTLEIRDFVSYMSPHEAEIKSRNEVVSKIRQAVKDLWKDAQAYVFGSFATDMYLPGSDIDIVVLSEKGRLTNASCLHMLAHKLRIMNIATNMQVLTKTRVPIIKFMETHSKINIDISFERTNGVQAVDLIRDWQKQYPALRHLAIVVKHFLARRNLNEVHTGGLGGLSVICMIVSFLANHPRIASGAIDPWENLGVLLLEFFELYGNCFNYDQLGLSMAGHMPYIRKDDCVALVNPRTTYTLAILDPLDNTNNLSRGSYNVSGIRNAFKGAYSMLCSRCYEANSLKVKWRRGMSLLGNIIQFKGPERDFADYTNQVRNESRDVSLSALHTSIERERADADHFYYDSTDDEIVEESHSSLKDLSKKTKSTPSSKASPSSPENLRRLPNANLKTKHISKPHFEPVSKHNPLEIEDESDSDLPVVVISDDDDQHSEIDDSFSRTRIIK